MHSLLFFLLKCDNCLVIMLEYIVSAQYFLMIELRQTCNYLFAYMHAQKLHRKCFYFIS